MTKQELEQLWKEPIHTCNHRTDEVRVLCTYADKDGYCLKQKCHREKEVGCLVSTR